MLMCLSVSHWNWSRVTQQKARLLVIVFFRSIFHQISLVDNLNRDSRTHVIEGWHHADGNLVDNDGTATRDAIINLSAYTLEQYYSNDDQDLGYLVLQKPLQLLIALSLLQGHT